ncbi:hypothetical protein H0H93_000762 [Arthromyces matolae]|nr:hypothetical protein H0H93_000762 [Arthromyces matolae]
MPQQIFSNEILSIFIDHLQDDIPSLRKVSLVNKAFAVFCRPYIWRKIVLPPPLRRRTATNNTPCAKLSAILHAADSPAELVKDFCINNTKNRDSEILSSDPNLPLVLNRLTKLTKFKVLEMIWPTKMDDPLIKEIRQILRSPDLNMATICASFFPTFVVGDCFCVQSLSLVGSSVLEPEQDSDVDMISPVGSTPQPHTLIMDVEPYVAEEIWPLLDTSRLRSLLLALPTAEDELNAVLAQRHHALEYLAINFMESAAEFPYPNFGSLDKVKELVIAFPTWLTEEWPATLAGLLSQLDSHNMSHLERIVLYWIVDPADTLISEAALHDHNAFRILDNQLTNMTSRRLSKVHVVLKPNSDPVRKIRGFERIQNELANTHAANLLTIETASGE